MKRMLREAAERGADKLAWTTGDQQAERYDLSKHLDRVDYYFYPNPEGTPSQGVLRAYNPDGEKVIEKVVSPDQLVDHVGKDVAQKLMEKENQSQNGNSNLRMGSVSGLDLKTGGEWAKALYDRAIPNFMNKYLKKYGVRVGTSEIPIVDKDVVRKLDRLDLEKANPPQKVHSIDLTPQMKRDLLKKGQPIASDKTFDAQGEQTA
jgi:hypothetical protein